MASEGRILAVSRPGKTITATPTGIPGAPPRVSFAKIREPLEVPNLLALQVDSFDWLVGNGRWRERATDAVTTGGLEEILNEISPIEDFSGSMSLSFSNPRFEDVKASVEECKDKDMTYSAPLFVTAEFTNNHRRGGRAPSRHVRTAEDRTDRMDRGGGADVESKEWRCRHEPRVHRPGALMACGSLCSRTATSRRSTAS